MVSRLGKLFIILLLVGLVGIVAACSNGNNEDPANEDPTNEDPTNEDPNGEEEPEPEPKFSDEVTLVLNNLAGAGGFLYDDFMFPSITENYPHITMERMYSAEIEEMIIAGEVQDIFFTSVNNFREFVQDHDLQYDLSELVEKYDYDLSRFSSSIINDIYAYSPNGDELYALPLTGNRTALIYNKEFFDRQNVPYPTDDMTWEDLYEIIPDLVHEEDGVRYRAITGGYLDGNQLSLRILDPETDEALADYDGWVRRWELIGGIPLIEGNHLDEDDAGAYNNFVNGHAAMIVNTNIPPVGAVDFDYGMVPIPDFPEKPNTGAQVNYTHFSVNNTSEYPEAAFQAIIAMLADDVMEELVRDGRQLAVEGIDNAALYAANRDDLPEDLNVGAFFAKQPASTPQMSRYELQARGPMFQAFQRVMYGEVDVQTALREVTEELNVLVQEWKEQD